MKKNIFLGMLLAALAWCSAAHATILNVRVVSTTASSVTMAWDNDIAAAAPSVSYAAGTIGTCAYNQGQFFLGNCAFTQQVVVTGLLTGTAYCLQPSDFVCDANYVETGPPVQVNFLGTPTSTTTPTASPTRTVTPSATKTKTPTSSPTVTRTKTVTFTITKTRTITMTGTVTPTATRTASKTASPTLTATPVVSVKVYGIAQEKFPFTATGGVQTLTFSTHKMTAGPGSLYNVYLLNLTTGGVTNAGDGAISLLLPSDAPTAIALQDLVAYQSGESQMSLYVPATLFTPGDNFLVVFSYLTVN